MISSRAVRCHHRVGWWRWLSRSSFCSTSAVAPSPPSQLHPMWSESVANPEALNVKSPFSHDFTPKERAEFVYDPNHQSRADRQKHNKENKVPKMAIQEAVTFAKENARGYFDESLSMTFQLNLDVRKADQILRSAAMLPHGTGKNLRVAVFAENEKADEAREAGADFVGGADLATFIENHKKAADRILATPEAMRYIGPVAKKLGSRGTMPNAKQGTIVRGSMKEAVHDAKFRLVTYRTKRQPIITAVVGKMSFPEEHLVDNIVALVDRIMTDRPSPAKNTKKYINAAYLKTTQGRAIPIKLGQPPFVESKLIRGWGIYPPRLMKVIERRERDAARRQRRAEEQLVASSATETSSESSQ